MHGTVEFVSPEQRAWDERLAAEGLAPIVWVTGYGSPRGRVGRMAIVDNSGSHGNDRLESHYRKPLRDVAELRPVAVERWSAWAALVLETVSFRTPRLRAVWALYAAGKAYGEIQAELKCRRRAISEAVAEVEASAPPKPCANPWRQDHRGVRNGTRVRHLNGFQKRKQREEREREDMEAKKPAPLVHYSRIVLMRGHEVTIPGATREKDVVYNAEGRIHAGGIEVMFISDKAGGERRKVVPHITIPWIHMKQAERVPEVDG